MSYLRVRHVFFGLMGLSALSAFVLPPRYATRVQPQIQGIFAPVSRPVRAVAAWVSTRVFPPHAEDRRAIADIREENQQLRADLAVLETQLEEMRRRNDELSKLGSARTLCRLVKVLGADAGSRESISISGSTLQGIKEDMYVLHPGGLVGQVSRAGIGGAQVRLITDPSFRARVRFFKYAPNSDGHTDARPLGIPIVLAEGAGRGEMVIRELTLREIGYDDKGKPQVGANDTLRDGDYMQLWDTDCPQPLKGEVIGRVTRISIRADHRLFAEIRVQPTASLKKLSEVMVMTREN